MVILRFMSSTTWFHRFLTGLTPPPLPPCHFDISAASELMDLVRKKTGICRSMKKTCHPWCEMLIDRLGHTHLKLLLLLLAGDEEEAVLLLASEKLEGCGLVSAEFVLPAAGSETTSMTSYENAAWRKAAHNRINREWLKERKKGWRKGQGKRTEKKT